VARAARLYYLEGQPQSQIAKSLDVSAPSVSRLLTRARDENLIQFTIAEPYASCLDLELELADAFGLAEVLVAPNVNDDPAATKKAVAMEAARLVQRVTTPEDIIGLAWGGTMYHLIHYLNPCRRVDASFVTMHGSISCCGPELDAANLVHRIAMAFGGHQFTIEADGLQDSVDEAGAISSSPDVAAVERFYERITFSISGVGSLYPQLGSRLVNSTYLTPSEINELTAAGAYGDLVLRFFDYDGNECDTSMRDRTLSITFDQYRQIPHRLVAAYGPQKAETVRAALRGNLLNVLVVDEGLARQLLQLA
jgi:deoxyribonucleoside regulator